MKMWAWLGALLVAANLMIITGYPWIGWPVVIVVGTFIAGSQGRP